MKETKTVIHVVAGAIFRNGKFLCAQRSSSQSQPNRWEFPGGKIEPGESPKQALKREVLEELACQIVVKKQLESVLHEYAYATIQLSTYFCELVEDEPKALEHQKLLWLYPRALESLNWADADLPAVRRIMELHSS